MIRAKFRCEAVTGHAGTRVKKDGSGYEGCKHAEVVKLAPVFAVDGPNKAWSEATPSGVVEMTITNFEAMGKFEVGKDYFIDFTPAAE